jgi:hypothetical protein
MKGPLGIRAAVFARRLLALHPRVEVSSLRQKRSPPGNGAGGAVPKAIRSFRSR